MISDTNPESTQSAELVAALKSGEDVGPEVLRLALINALDRIATLEQEWAEVKAAWKWFGSELQRKNPGENT